MLVLALSKLGAITHANKTRPFQIISGCSEYVRSIGKFCRFQYILLICLPSSLFTNIMFIFL